VTTVEHFESREFAVERLLSVTAIDRPEAGRLAAEIAR
jgi:hypothetical protein